jgi:hypothetical protein
MQVKMNGNRSELKSLRSTTDPLKTTWQKCALDAHNWTHTGAVHTRGFSTKSIFAPLKKTVKETQGGGERNGVLLRENITKN